MAQGKQPSSEKFFFGRIAREQAEKALKNAGTGEGLFLLRESMGFFGNYVLSICHEGRYVRSCGVRTLTHACERRILSPYVFSGLHRSVKHRYSCTLYTNDIVYTHDCTYKFHSVRLYAHCGV